MPRTRFQSFVFTLITAWMMVYVMTLYNIVLASGTFVNETFLIALKGMWVEFVIIFLCAYFISSRIAKYFAFRVVQPGDRPIAIICFIQIFTVISQVALASILGAIKGYGYYAVTDNIREVKTFLCITKKLLFKWLNRRSQRRSYTWKTFNEGLLRTFPLLEPSIKVSLFYR